MKQLTIIACLLAAPAGAATESPFTHDVFAGPFGVRCVQKEDLGPRVWSGKWGEVPRTCADEDAPLSRDHLADLTGKDRAADVPEKDWQAFKYAWLIHHNDGEPIIERPPAPVVPTPAVPLPDSWGLLLGGLMALYVLKGRARWIEEIIHHRETTK